MFSIIGMNTMGYVLYVINKVFVTPKLSYFNDILWKYLYSLTQIFVVSTKHIDPWVLGFMVSNTTGNSQWENCILLDFNFCSLSKPRNPRKLEPHI